MCDTDLCIISLLVTSLLCFYMYTVLCFYMYTVLCFYIHRGSAAEWYEILTSHFRTSKTVRQWFADNILFSHPERFSEYLLECSSSEVRVTSSSMNHPPR